MAYQRLAIVNNGVEIVDALGTIHPCATSEVRIASLVPSITELLCSLGLSNKLVARTGFCIHPKDTVKQIPKVGGTKDVDLARLKSLNPTHCVVNIDENRKETAEQLAEFVDHVVVTHPMRPADNEDLFLALGALFGRHAQAETLCERFRQRMQSLLRNKAFQAQRVLYLIWKNPWMTVSNDTYISEMLSLINWQTVCHDEAVRYPEIVLDQYVGKVDQVLLSTEPYRFQEKHVDEVQAIFGDDVKVRLIDGELISWYGSRAIDGMGYLQKLGLAA